MSAKRWCGSRLADGWARTGDARWTGQKAAAAQEEARDDRLKARRGPGVSAGEVEGELARAKKGQVILEGGSGIRQKG